jgi:hypothetical protein
MRSRPRQIIVTYPQRVQTFFPILLLTRKSVAISSAFTLLDVVWVRVWLPRPSDPSSSSSIVKSKSSPETSPSWRRRDPRARDPWLPDCLAGLGAGGVATLTVLWGMVVGSGLISYQLRPDRLMLAIFRELLVWTTCYALVSLNFCVLTYYVCTIYVYLRCTDSKVVVVRVKERIHVTTCPRLLILMQKFQRRVFGPCHVLSEQPVVKNQSASVCVTC